MTSKTEREANTEKAALTDRQSSLREGWQASRKCRILWLAGLTALLFILLLAGLSNGGASFNIRESWKALLSGITLSREEMETSQKIIWQLRVPRVLMAITGGMGLATAGLVMQTILRNPLASPPISFFSSS